MYAVREKSFQFSKWEVQIALRFKGLDAFRVHPDAYTQTPHPRITYH
jgi:hypothetical protein